MLRSFLNIFHPIQSSSLSVPQAGGKVAYIDTSKLHPGQTRYSSLNTIEKVSKAKASGAAIWHADTSKWEYQFNHGTSIFAEKAALPVVRSSFGYVLVDGHHDVMSSIELQATTVPVRVIADLSHLSQDAFWMQAEKNSWAYLESIHGERTIPPKSFAKLIDDPNRYFAAVTARKYFPNESGGYTSIGAEYPLWIKISKDTPFIEFKIANALYRNGFVYTAIDNIEAPPVELVELARKILLAENVSGLRVVPERVHYADLQIDSSVPIIKNASH